MNRTSFHFIVLLFLSLGSFKGQSICTATANGDWANASTWSCPGGVVCGSTVIIPAGITVSITTQQNYGACTPTPAAALQIYVHGKLKFDTGNKLTLPCGSNVYVGATGTVDPGNGSGNSNYIEICTNIVWNAGDGPLYGPTALCSNPPCSTVPLPIELVAFTGSEEQKIVHLYWKTGTETNNNYYDVERSSNGIDFEKVATVDSKAPNGTSLGPLEYNTTDNDLRSPVYYYRLKQVDKNGTFKRTGIISVRIFAAEFTIYPNPNTGVFSIEVPSLNMSEPMTVVVYNSLGEKVYESVQTIVNDQITGSRVDITPVKPLPTGVYLTTVTFLSEKRQLKLIVR